MSSNSKREKIILAVKAEIEEITTVKTVLRTIPTIQDLQNFAITQLPVVAMVAGLPVPSQHKTSRSLNKDVFLSDLTIELFTYFQDNQNTDTALSSLLDDLWVKLYQDQTKGGLTIYTTLKPIPVRGYWKPFYAFKLDLVLTYYHDTGGI